MNGDLQGIRFRAGEDLVYDHQGRPLPESEAVLMRWPAQQKGMTARGPVDAEDYREYHLRRA